MSAATRPTTAGPGPGCVPPEAGPPLPGEWLFQAGGQVYGPIAGAALVELIWAGRVGRATPVASEDGAWRPLAEAPGALVHLAKAEARARVEADVRRARWRSAARRGGVLLLVAAVLLAGGWLLSSQPWRGRGELLDDLGPGLSLAAVKVGASARAEVEEIAIPSGPARAQGGAASSAPERTAKPARRLASAAPRPRGGGEDRRAAPAPSGSGNARSAASGGPATGDVAGGDLVVSRYDPRRIEEGVTRQRGTLAPCLREEARRSPDFSGEIPIEFAIGNDGKVAALWIDEPRFKSGPLRECLLQQLQRWSFDPFPGSRPVVSLAFRVGPP